ncbi:MAG: DUF4340 domain-containing protein, partial [Spirochaetaceae bacterium]|nr:DUF4340 domain-containing protein [Spirochaetaceae bacterium]
MKKETFNIVLLILLIALAGIYLMIRDMNNVEESKNIININNDSIFEIDIKTKSDIIIEKESDLWIINTGKLEYKADQKKIEIIKKTLENLSYRRIIDKSAGNLKKYGLENPSVTVVMHLKNDVSKLLSIGDETSSGSQFYAMLRGEKTVYTIDSAFVKTLTGTVLDFRDRNISVTTEYLIDEIRIAREGAET